MRVLIMVLAALSLATAPLAANPPLREVAEIDDGLLALGIADRIRKQCPEISARMLRALLFVQNLEQRALQMGYSEAEIEAYTDSDAEKARMRGRAATYFKGKGVGGDDPQGLCALGRAEIAADSAIGRLLRAR